MENGRAIGRVVGRDESGVRLGVVVVGVDDMVAVLASSVSEDSWSIYSMIGYDEFCGLGR